VCLLWTEAWWPMTDYHVSWRGAGRRMSWMDVTTSWSLITACAREKAEKPDALGVFTLMQWTGQTPHPLPPEVLLPWSITLPRRPQRHNIESELGAARGRWRATESNQVKIIWSYELASSYSCANASTTVSTRQAAPSEEHGVNAIPRAALNTSQWRKRINATTATYCK